MGKSCLDFTERSRKSSKISPCKMFRLQGLVISRSLAYRRYRTEYVSMLSKMSSWL